ncbi:uncharacterized protein LOC132706536 [Cylas formicarius]|uniref:uncharacterized protein LOC132706536 n=1 Tax=Cylas formicarius TaxID=197179 RepID=UPI002958B55E|nr:uncharacterized protein LOC132706536 [Cylas formicarius]
MGNINHQAVLVFLAASIATQADSTVSRCYLCNNNYCADPYEATLGTVSHCIRDFQLGRLSSASELDYGVDFEATAHLNGKPDDVELLEDDATAIRRKLSELFNYGDASNSTHESFVDIKRKIWELFNKTGIYSSRNEKLRFPGENISNVSDRESALMETHEEIFDLKRKLWDFFYRLGIDEHTPFVCVKTIYSFENGLNRTYRGCVPNNHKGVAPCDAIASVIGVESSRIYGCETCTKDLCNSATSLGQSALALAVGVVLRWLM